MSIIFLLVRPLWFLCVQFVGNSVHISSLLQEHSGALPLDLL